MQLLFFKQGLNEDVLSTTFETFWPKIDDALKSVENTVGSVDKSKTAESDQTPIEEILELMRYQHKLLKSPNELLPPDYLVDVFRRAEKFRPSNYTEDVDMFIRRIIRTAESILERYSDDGEQLKFTPQLMEIRELARRARMLIREMS